MLVEGDLEFHDALVAAMELFEDGLPGHLATLETEAESNFIKSLLPAPIVRFRVWIGLIQAKGSSEPDGGWGWINDDPYTFQDWRNDEPNDNGSAAFGELYGDPYLLEYGWNDVGIHDYAYDGFVVEFDLEAVPVEEASASQLKAIFRDD